MATIQINPFGRRQRLRNNEFMTYCTEVQIAIEKAGTEADALNCETAAQNFSQALAAYAEAIVVVSKSAITKQIDEADRERDDLFVGLTEHIRTAQRHYDPDRRVAAAALMPIVDTYAGTQIKPAADETSYLNNFMDDMRAEKYTAYRAALDIDGWLAQLQTANEKYVSLSEQRATDQSTNIVGNSKTTRKALDKAYSELVQVLNALCLVNGEEKYAGLFAYLNTRIKYYEDLVARREGTAAAKATDSNTGTEQTAE